MKIVNVSVSYGYATVTVFDGQREFHFSGITLTDAVANAREGTTLLGTTL